MTWVIGGITPFGYGVGLSDIRVSWGEKNYRDCLQKVYPVGKFIIAGFSGSVKLGFRLIEDLSNFLFLDNPDEAWIPEWVAVNWWRRARRFFNIASPKLQKLGASILIVGIHPHQNEGESPWSKGLACSFSSPTFEPHFAERGQFISIGSGSMVEEYINMLRDSTKMFDNASLQAEVGWRGGFGHNIKINLTEALMNYRVQSVSPHLHIFIAERGHLSVGTNDHKRSSKDGLIEFKMPWVAKSYEEFDKYCKAENINSAIAIC